MTIRYGMDSGILLAVLLGLACAPAVAPGRDIANRQIITPDEIEALNAANADEVIRKVRPNFLSSRGETSLGRSRSSRLPTVYVDGMAFGTVATLRTIPAMQIESIRLYRSWEATTRFGLGNTSGVIEITTKR